MLTLSLTVFQSLVKYCKRDDPQVRKWAAEYEEAAGTKIFEFIQDWRSQPSPPQQHLHPSHSQQKQPQAHAHTNSFNAPHQLPHRRLSDVRNSSNPNFSLNMSNPASTRHQLTAESSSYSNTTNNVMKRSPSHSPPTSYSLGRPQNSNMNVNSGSNSRDVRVQSSLNNTAVPSVEREGITNEPSLTQSQGHSVVGKFSNRDSNQSHSHLRWPSAAGGSGDLGMQTSYSGATGGGGAAGPSDVNGVPPGRMVGGSNDAGVGSSTLNGNSGASSHRTVGLLGEGYQSLPSLKASGLLDSWPGNTSSKNSGESQKQNGSAATQSLSSSQRTNLSNLNLMIPAQSLHPSLPSDPADLRPTTLATMPVGLQWLANESR